MAALKRCATQNLVASRRKQSRWNAWDVSDTAVGPGYNLTREILHRRGKKPNGCARNRLSRMIGVHE